MQSSNNSDATRKQRIVKNGDVDIDHVSSLPGHAYINWMKIAKQKLNERESVVMSRRINIVQTLIIKEIDLFKKHINKTYGSYIYVDLLTYKNIIYENTAIPLCLQKMNTFLETWKGPRVKYQLNTFRKYFTLGKYWFDQRKKEILATEFWTVVFDIIVKLTHSLAQHFTGTFVRSKFQRAILSTICATMFETKWRFPASKPQPLISLGFVKSSKVFQDYLTAHIMDFDLKLTMQLPAKDMLLNIVNQLRIQSDQATTIFINALPNHEHNNNNNNNNNNNDNAFDDSNEKLYAEGVIVDLGINPFVNISQTFKFQNYNGYNGYHTSPHLVSDTRFSPNGTIKRRINLS